MAYLNEFGLLALGFRRLGKHVLISDKTSIYNPELIEIGDHSRIDDYCVLSGRLVIGRNVHIAVFCNIAGGEKGVFLEDFSGLSYGCHIFSQSDDYSGNFMTNPTIPDIFKKETKAPVLVKKYSIIGACSIIFPGVTLEEGTSVGAMSMVTRSTKEWSIYVGIPAKKIKTRSRNLLQHVDNYLNNERLG